MSSEAQPKILALAGGVGGAKLCVGLAATLPPADLQIVVNTGDDFRHLGLAISPDLDSVLYALAGLNDSGRGWGRADETWNFMAGLRRLGAPDWFQLGDLDLATHVLRTDLLQNGDSLSRITADLARRFGIAHSVAPMSDDPVQTVVDTDQGALAFQEYFVARQCAPRLKGLRFEGAAVAKPSPAFAAALASPHLQAIVICPSNPFVSIDPILSLPGIRDTLARRRAPLVAVSPIIAGKAVKGPAAKMMAELGMPASATAIAHHYDTLLDGLVIDQADIGLRAQIEAQGCAVLVRNTLMRTLEDRTELARATIDFALSLHPRR